MIVIVNCFFSVFLSFRTYPIGIDGADECFYCELACKEKHTGTALETQSRPERKCFLWFSLSFWFSFNICEICVTKIAVKTTAQISPIATIHGSPIFLILERIASSPRPSKTEISLTERPILTYLLSLPSSSLVQGAYAFI